MERKRFQATYWIISFLSMVSIMQSCRDKDGMTYILSDISSNAYYICLKVICEGNTLETVVIPNNQLYYIIVSETKEGFGLESYINLLLPKIKEHEALESTEEVYDKLKPYFLPSDWASKNIKIGDYFKDGVQFKELNEEGVLIMQLYLKGYLVYKDDETGLLVLRDVD